MKRHFSFALLILCLSYIHLQAQRDKELTKAIINLHDGSTLIGEIIEENKSHIRLLIYTGDSINVDRRLINKFQDSNEDLIIYENGKYHFRQGIFWNLGLGLNLFTDSRPSSHIDVKIGHRVNTHFSIAAGLAFEYNRAMVSGLNFDTQFNTAYAYGRYYFNNSKQRYFVYSRVGYGFPLDDEDIEEEHSGGWQTQNGIGIHFASRRKSRLVISLGHHFQDTRGEESFIDTFGNEVLTEFDVLISRAILKFSWEFK